MSTKAILLLIKKEKVDPRIIQHLQEELDNATKLRIFSDPTNVNYYIDKSINKNKVVIIDTICANSTMSPTINRIPVNIVGFCFNIDPSSQRQNISWMVPYISLAEIIAVRIKNLFIELKEVNLNFSLSNSDLKFLSDFYDISNEQLLSLIRKHLTCVEGVGHAIHLFDIDTSIYMTAIGKMYGYKDIHRIDIKFKFGSNLFINSYFAQLASFLLLINRFNMLIKSCLTIEIGKDEGLYTFYLSKLIGYGGEYEIRINNNYN